MAQVNIDTPPASLGSESISSTCRNPPIAIVPIRLISTPHPLPWGQNQYLQLVEIHPLRLSPPPPPTLPPTSPVSVFPTANSRDVLRKHFIDESVIHSRTLYFLVTGISPLSLSFSFFLSLHSLFPFFYSLVIYWPCVWTKTVPVFLFAAKVYQKQFPQETYH